MAKVRVPEQHRTGIRPEFPSLAIFLIDFIVSAIVAWVIPDGINRIAKALGFGEALPGLNTQSRVGIFLVTALIVYGFVMTRACGKYLEYMVESIQNDLPDVFGGQVKSVVEGALKTEIAGLLIGSSRLDARHQAAQSELVHDYLSRLDGEYPLAVQKIAHYFARDHLDGCFNQLRALASDGLDIDVHRNVQLIRVLAQDATSFVFIDPTLYGDLSDDWSQAWFGFLRQLRAQTHTRKTYVVLSGPEKTLSAKEQNDRYSRLHGIRKVLEEHEFEVRYCEPRDLRRVDPSIDLLTTAMSIVNDTDIILNKAQIRYTDEKLLRTIVLTADQKYSRFLEMVRDYSKPVSKWPEPPIARID